MTGKSLRSAAAKSLVIGNRPTSAAGRKKIRTTPPTSAAGERKTLTARRTTETKAVGAATPGAAKMMNAAAVVLAARGLIMMTVTARDLFALVARAA